MEPQSTKIDLDEDGVDYPSELPSTPAMRASEVSSSSDPLSVGHTPVNGQPQAKRMKRCPSPPSKADLELSRAKKIFEALGIPPSLVKLSWVPAIPTELPAAVQKVVPTCSAATAAVTTTVGNSNSNELGVPPFVSTVSQPTALETTFDGHVDTIVQAGTVTQPQQKALSRCGPCGAN